MPTSRSGASACEPRSAGGRVFRPGRSRVACKITTHNTGDESEDEPLFDGRAGLVGDPASCRGLDDHVRRQGLASIVHNGVVLVNPADGRFVVQGVAFTDPREERGAAGVAAETGEIGL